MEDKKNKRLNHRGFTLIELMVVVVILGILAGLIVPKIMDAPEKAKRQKARMQIEALETALKMYKLDNGTYPSSLQGLTEHPEGAKNWRKGGYLEKGKVPKDPWNNDFAYQMPGSHGGDYDLSSYGADGVAGGEDDNKDINSWDTE